MTAYAERAELLDQVQAVRELHVPLQTFEGELVCVECARPFPCPPIVAIGGAR